MSAPPHQSYVFLSVAQMRQAEAYAMQNGVDEKTLMQNAAHAVYQTITQIHEKRPTTIICGPGNNGGDGYLVGKLLHDDGWDVRILAHARASDLNQWAKDQYAKPALAIDPQNLRSDDLIVDALYGTGLTRPLEGNDHAIIGAIATHPCISIDLPSGINADDGQIMGCTPMADHCVSFFQPKRAHGLMPAIKHIGQLHIADIGIPDAALAAIDDQEFLHHNTPAQWQDLLRHPALDTHKYRRGHVFVHGGHAHPAAAYFAAQSAFRTGCGFVTLGYDEQTKDCYRNMLSSIVLVQCVDRQHFIDLTSNCDCLVIGPGNGINFAIRDRVIAALQTKTPMVIDADALSIFADNWELLSEHATHNAVLTPHHGEFERIFGKLMHDHGDPQSKVTRTQIAAKHANATIVYKGFDTIIAAPDGQVSVSTNASPYLATAGSGDVLCGIIATFLAQKLPSFMAASAGVWVHGQLPHIAPGIGWIAQDFCDNIPTIVAPLLSSVPNYNIKRIENQT